jgi:hypothetical protein
MDHGKERVDADAKEGQHILAERRSCRYEQHECQLLS